MSKRLVQIIAETPVSGSIDNGVTRLIYKPKEIYSVPDFLFRSFVARKWAREVTQGEIDRMAAEAKDAAAADDAAKAAETDPAQKEQATEEPEKAPEPAKEPAQPKKGADKAKPTWDKPK